MRMAIRLSKKHKALMLIIFILCYATASIAFIYNTWSISIKEIEDEAIQLANAAAAGIQKSSVAKLSGKPRYVGLSEYIEIKNSLSNLVKLDNDIRFAYLYVYKNDKIYFLADSEPTDSKDYSPPGQEFTEATQEFFLPFRTGHTLLSGPTTDRWGAWMSVLVPMRDIETGNVIAILGVDYPAESWNHTAVTRTIQAGIVVLCVFLIFTAFLLIIKRNRLLKNEKEKLVEIDAQLKESEELFRTLYAQAPIGVAFCTSNGEIIDVNPMYGKIFGRTKDELKNLGWVKITHPDDINIDSNNFNKYKNGEIETYSIVKRYVKPDGEIIWGNINLFSLKDSNNLVSTNICMLTDITERIIAEKALLESERSKAILLSHLPGLAYRCEYDSDWTMQFVSDGCYKLTGYKAESLIGNKEFSFNEIIAPEYRNILCREWERVLALRTSFRYEYEIITKAEKRLWVLEMGQGIYDDDGNVEALEGIIIDISERKVRESEIQYMYNHDCLTGLYNRKFYEEAMDNMSKEDNLPTTIMLIDFNGLRLINESFGYSEGDMLIKTTSQILQSCSRPDDVLARLGGSGFGLLLPKTDNEAAYEMQKLIEETCSVYNKNKKTKLMHINLSIGFATKASTEDCIKQTDREAHEFLRQNKLLNRRSFHSDIILSIMATVNEKSHITNEHAVRLKSLCRKLGGKLDLTRKSLDELELLAILHDIGKVGIDDKVLNKPGSLDEDEWVIMKRHPEIGYRIAKASSVLEPIADYILSHHERWDGKGYPRGLKGGDIPLLSRILAVADAYDAMTEDRVYRKAMQKEAAITEIRDNAGTQFDPQIVQIFCECITQQNNNSLNAF